MRSLQNLLSGNLKLAVAGAFIFFGYGCVSTDISKTENRLPVHTQQSNRTILVETPPRENPIRTTLDKFIIYSVLPTALFLYP